MPAEELIDGEPMYGNLEEGVQDENVLDDDLLDDDRADGRRGTIGRLDSDNERTGQRSASPDSPALA